VPPIDLNYLSLAKIVSGMRILLIKAITLPAPPVAAAEKDPI
jgi:hypothetical protein